MPETRCLTSPWCWLVQHAISQQALKVLEEERDAQGRRLQITKVPTPPPLYITQEEEAGTKVTFIHSRSSDIDYCMRYILPTLLPQATCISWSLYKHVSRLQSFGTRDWDPVQTVFALPVHGIL